jgi:hypothetical protein
MGGEMWVFLVPLWWPAWCGKALSAIPVILNPAHLI